MYDPSIGVWLNRDPIGYEGEDENLYRYVKNRPTMGLDPYGLKDLSDGSYLYVHTEFSHCWGEVKDYSNSLPKGMKINVDGWFVGVAELEQTLRTAGQDDIVIIVAHGYHKSEVMANDWIDTRTEGSDAIKEAAKLDREAWWLEIDGDPFTVQRMVDAIGSFGGPAILVLVGCNTHLMAKAVQAMTGTTVAMGFNGDLTYGTGDVVAGGVVSALVNSSTMSEVADKYNSKGGTDICVYYGTRTDETDEDAERQIDVGTLSLDEVLVGITPPVTGGGPLPRTPYAGVVFPD